MPNDTIPPEEARRRVAEWAYAIDKHPDFAHDLKQCYAESRVEDWDAHTVSLRTCALKEWRALDPLWPFDYLPALQDRLDDNLAVLRHQFPDSDETDFLTFLAKAQRYSAYREAKLNAVLDWIKRRYDGLWRQSLYLHLSGHLVDWALYMAATQHGEWSPVINSLVGPAGESNREPFVTVSVFNDAKKLVPPWKNINAVHYSDYTHEPMGSHPVLVLHLNSGAQEPDAVQAVKKHWKRVQPFIEQPLGKRGRGKPRSFSNDMAIYLEWRNWLIRKPDGTTGQFAWAIKKGSIVLEHWGDPKSGGSVLPSLYDIRATVDGAIEWLKPRDSVPSCLADHLEPLRNTY